MTKMQLGKWGRSLAVRMPRILVDRLGLKEGDMIDMDALEYAVTSARQAQVKERRQSAMMAIRARQWTLPDNYTFDRDEANAR